MRCRGKSESYVFLLSFFGQFRSAIPIPIPIPPPPPPSSPRSISSHFSANQKKNPLQSKLSFFFLVNHLAPSFELSISWFIYLFVYFLLSNPTTASLASPLPLPLSFFSWHFGACTAWVARPGKSLWRELDAHMKMNEPDNPVAKVGIR